MGGSKVDNDINIGVFGNGFGYFLVDWEKSFVGVLVYFVDELVVECVDDVGDGGGCLFVDEVEIEYVLYGVGLYVVDEVFCFVVEESVGGERV